MYLCHTLFYIQQFVVYIFFTYNKFTGASVLLRQRACRATVCCSSGVPFGNVRNSIRPSSLSIRFEFRMSAATVTSRSRVPPFYVYHVVRYASHRVQILVNFVAKFLPELEEREQFALNAEKAFALCQRKVCVCSDSQYLISQYLISQYLILQYLISQYLILQYLISQYLNI